MAKRHQEILDKLDPIGISRYNITEADIEAVEQYLGIIQANLPGVSLWQDIIEFPGAYATSLVVHELVEIRLLKAQGVDLFKLDTASLQQLLSSNIDVHSQATFEEHYFLQDYINQHYQQLFQVGTLLKVNRQDVDEEDFQLLLASDIGVFIVEDSRLEDVRKIIGELRGESP